MLKFSHAVCLLLFYATFHSDSVSAQIKMRKSAPHVQLSNPKQLIRGTVLMSREERPYYSFQGVRYANPPKRFQIAEPLDPQTTSDFIDVSQFGSSCARWSRFWKKFAGSEDCLFLNVYVPMKDVEEFKPLPVMLYIHGGAFIDGESDYLGAEYFMDQNVILVTINYRLGALGFLSTGDSVVPGNMGLHDQAHAIKWVYENIQEFSGDQNRIVIFGESAGSASVSLQLLYHGNDGRISGAISQSGTVHSPWCIQSPAEARNNLMELSNYVGCSDKKSSSEELIKCLESKKWEDLIEQQKKIKKWFHGSGITFGPVIEVESEEKPSFLTKSPEYLMKHGYFIDVPYIIGIVEEEGHFLYSAVVLKSEQLTEELNNEWTRIAPDAFFYENKLKDGSKSDKVSNKIRDFYFGKQEIDESTRQALTDVYSDAMFNYPTQKTAKVWSENGGQVYTYIFKYNGEFTMLKTWVGVDNLKVVSHADELQYLFKTNKYGSKTYFSQDSESERISKSFVNLWASFAANGSPTNTWGSAPTWYPLARGKDMFWYQLDSDTSINDSFDKERHAFWDQLRAQYFIDFSETDGRRTAGGDNNAGVKEEL